MSHGTKMDESGCENVNRSLRSVKTRRAVMIGIMVCGVLLTAAGAGAIAWEVRQQWGLWTHGPATDRQLYH